MLEKLLNDMKEAMKSKNKEKLTVIRGVKALLDKERIDKKIEANDDLLLDVVSKEIKIRKEAIFEFEKANRLDLVEKNNSEISILLEYLPEQLSLEEIKEEINNIFGEVNPTGIKDMGKVMSLANLKLKGKADMKEVSSIIREKLNSL